jgi:hypothetical protein
VYKDQNNVGGWAFVYDAGNGSDIPVNSGEDWWVIESDDTEPSISKSVSSRVVSLEELQVAEVSVRWSHVIAQVHLDVGPFAGFYANTLRADERAADTVVGHWWSEVAGDAV